MTRGGSGIAHQQDQSALPLSGVATRAATNKLGDLRPLAPAIPEALEALLARTLVLIP